jgi:Zn-dependent protease with chaperone function
VAPAAARPEDAKVGDVRAILGVRGGVIRSAANAMAAPVTTLAYGTKVTVAEVRQPWLRVTASGPGGATIAGWILARETIEPAALEASGPRAPTAAGGGRTGVSSREVSAAGRQFDSQTEQGYRGLHPNLDAAFPLVDDMERATADLDAEACVLFIQRGRLGRADQDWDRPPLLPPSGSGRAATRRRPGGSGLGRLLGGLVEEATGEERLGEALAAGVEGIAQVHSQMRERFTPEQEYFLGRAVAANAIARYGVAPETGMREFVRRVGDVLVRKSTRVPPTFGGYHFEVLDSDEVNGVSGPGGFVLVTRGAVAACRTEDELAGILAHELSHSTLKHGENTIRQGKVFQAQLDAFVKTTAAATGLEDAAYRGGLLKFFDQVVGEAARTAVEEGYGKDKEFEADLEGTRILMDVVYAHGALRDLLRRIPHAHGHYGGGTHAPPAVRAATLDAAIAQWGQPHPSVLEAATLRAERMQRWLAPPPR